MRRWVWGMLALMVSSLLFVGSALAERKVAFLVGIKEYPSLATKEDPGAGQLVTPLHDVDSMAETLKSIGFDVTTAKDVGRNAFFTAFEGFQRKISPGDVVLFFYAGHGVGLPGGNFLLPNDLPAGSTNSEALMRNVAIPERAIIEGIQDRGAGLTIVVLDSCRNNPIEDFVRKQARASGRAFTRSNSMLSRGLTRSDPVQGVLSIYSAGHGQTALDRLGPNDPIQNSVFTRVFAAKLKQPGLSLGDLVSDLQQEVHSLALNVLDENGQPHLQEPASYNQTRGGRIYLAGLPATPAVATLGSEAPAADAALWNLLKETTDAAALRGFVRQFPSSPYRPEAEALIRTLEGPKLAGPPVPATRPVLPCGKEIVVGVSQTVRPPRALSRVEECSLRVQETFKECAECPEMVVVPAGTFEMGSSTRDEKRSADETPQHAVTIAQAFAVGRFEVTVDQFAAFVQQSGYDAGSKCSIYEGRKREDMPGRSWRSPGFNQSGAHPVTCVNWRDAKAYIDWLSRTTGKPYRLLSEAEWEYGARSGNTGRFGFGDQESDLCAHGNGVDLTAKKANPSWAVVSTCSDGHVFTAPVGSFAPNKFGLHDMHGNVWEWTEDCWNESYRGAPSDGAAWITGNCGGRILRGGSWTNNPGDLRAAFRNREGEEDRIANVGLRVARTLLK